MRPIFSNVADQIRIGELVATGHLVPPRTFVLDVGVQEDLAKVKCSGDDFDMTEVSRVMNTVPVNAAVIRHWQAKAADRQTVVFCSTVEHARSVTECPLCGHVWERSAAVAGTPLGDFVMTEIDLLKRSSFRWCDLFGDDAALVASGFNAWSGIFFLNGRWYGIGGLQRQHPHLLAIDERTVCLAAADDWLNQNETDESAHKTRRWLGQAPTDKQLALLPSECRQDFGLTRYQASALLAFRFNRQAIRSLVFDANAASLGRAA